MQFTEKDVVAAVDGNKLYDFPKGVCAFFVALSDEWGWKGYWYEAQFGPERVDYYSTRDYNYEMSVKASKLDLGPKVGDKLDVVLWGRVYKGFIVQRATTVREAIDDNIVEYDDAIRMMNLLEVRLDRAALGSEDIGFNNAGFVPHLAEIVAIDFSHNE